MLNTKLLSLQLWSVRDLFSGDYAEMIRKVAGMGYNGIEFAGGYGNLSSDQMNALLKECGLVAIGSHVPYKQLTDNINAVIEYNLAIGNKYIICPGAPFKVKEDYIKMCDVFNNFGEICGKNGLLFGYHNHSYEFYPLEDGSIGYDILLNGTDPDKVFFEMDTGWVGFAGCDPVEYCKKFPGRFKLAHIKDYKAERSADGKAIQTDIGTGVMDFTKVIPALKENGTHYLIVEQEEGIGESIEYVNRSLKNLRKTIDNLELVGKLG